MTTYLLVLEEKKFIRRAWKRMISEKRHLSSILKNVRGSVNCLFKGKKIKRQGKVSILVSIG